MIEFEQVKMIRKRARTELHHCVECSALTDYVSFRAAAKLFEIDETSLREFVSANSIHFIATGDGGVCVTSLLEKMQTLGQLRANGRSGQLKA